jgi:hypothetical protein
LCDNGENGLESRSARANTHLRQNLMVNHR